MEWAFWISISAIVINIINITLLTIYHLNQRKENKMKKQIKKMKTIIKCLKHDIDYVYTCDHLTKWIYCDDKIKGLHCPKKRVNNG